MIFELPCRLGESFQSFKFKNWVENKRVFDEDKTLLLKEFEMSLFGIVCVGLDKHENTTLLSFGQNNVSYKPLYKIDIEDKYFSYFSLKSWGFPCENKGVLIGICLQDGIECAHFCIQPRYAHVYFAIDGFEYGDGTAKQIFIKYNKEKDKERIRQKKVREMGELGKMSMPLILNDVIKEKIRTMTIEEAKQFGLKLRKIDISESNIGVVGKKYVCIIERKNLNKRNAFLPKTMSIENVKLDREKIYFYYKNVDNMGTL